MLRDVVMDVLGFWFTLFSKERTRAFTLVLGCSDPISSELEESCKACRMSPVDMAEVIRRPRDLVGVLLLLSDPFLGDDLLDELMVGLIAEGIEGERDIELKEGDFDMPRLLLAEWIGVITPDALDLGRWCSLSESLAYNSEKINKINLVQTAEKWVS